MSNIISFQKPSPSALSEAQKLSDYELVKCVLNGEAGLYELIMRRYNQRLFRIARSVLKDDGEAEDVVQDAWIQAFNQLASFRGPEGFAGWISRIATNLALMRLRKADLAKPHINDNEHLENAMSTPPSLSTTPESAFWQRELRYLIEAAIDDLPDNYRMAFVLREIEQLSVEETAQCLGIKPATVKTRVFRAKKQLQERLNQRTDNAISEAFSFAGERCDRIVIGVFAKLSQQFS